MANGRQSYRYLWFLGPLLPLLLPPVAAQASESSWPHLRGPTYDGISSDSSLANRWPNDGPLALWTLDLGQGYSGFCAHDGRVYTQTQTLYGQYLVCLDGDTGRQIWRSWYDWPYEGGGMYAGPRATPTWSDEHLYFAGPRGDLSCAKADSGKLLWSVNLYERFQAPQMGFGYSCSPLVLDGKVIMPLGGNGSSVVALDARDGSTIWAAGDEPGSYCSATPISFAGRTYIVAFLQNSLASFELETGKLVWQHQYSQGYDEHAAFPLYQEPYLLIASPFRGGSMLYRLQVDSSAAGASLSVAAILQRQSDRLSNDTASSILLDGHVYGFDLRDMQAKTHRPSRGEFRCLELLSGEVRWSSDQTGHASVLAADGKLILFNDRGEVLLVRAAADRYEELGRAAVFHGEICWTAPALHRGRLYLRSPTQATCLYLGEPEELTKPQRAAAQPVATMPKRLRIDYSRLAGSERPYPFDPPSKQELKCWYLYSLLGVLGPALAALSGVCLLYRRRSEPHAAMRSRQAFFLTAFLAGIVGMPLYNRLSDEFVFTWPCSLFVAWQAILIVSVSLRQRPDRSARRQARVAGLMFFLVLFVYFHACLRLGMAIEWFYLVGLPLASPAAILAAYRMSRRVSPLEDVLWTTLAWSVYFWISGAFAIWKMSPGA